MLGNFEGQPEPKPVKIINEIIEEKLIKDSLLPEPVEEKLIKDSLLPEPEDSGRNMVGGLIDFATDDEAARKPIEPKERDFLGGLDFRAEDPTQN